MRNLCPARLHQLDFCIALRRHADMAAFALDRHITVTCGNQRRHSKPGAGPDHQKRRIHRSGSRQNLQIAMRRRVGLGQGLCSEVIDHQQTFKACLGQQACLAEMPVIIGHIDLGCLNRACNGNAGGIGGDTSLRRIGGKGRGK